MLSESGNEVDLGEFKGGGTGGSRARSDLEVGVLLILAGEGALDVQSVPFVYRQTHASTVYGLLRHLPFEQFELQVGGSRGVSARYKFYELVCIIVTFAGLIEGI